MTQTPRIVYRTRDDATPEAQASALAGIYRLVLDSAKKRGRLLDKSGPDDEKERSRNASLASTSIPR
jgi:hypothetical protein